MPEPRGFRRAVAGVAGSLLLSGCASAPPPREDLAPILPASESEMLTAPPAARDALDAGLRWIVQDAPGTIGPASDPSAPPASRERAAESVAELSAAISPEASPAPPPASSHVTVTALDLRRDPGLHSAILATLPAGSEVVARERSGEWVLVRTALGEGWVPRAWLQERSEPEGPEALQDSPGAAAATPPKGAVQ